MPRTSLDDLAAFASVARLKSFTRAAALLETSTSNLSHTIKRLETRLGLRLLQRNSRSVAANTAGEALLSHLAPALQGIEEALEELAHRHAGPAGRLRLTMTREGYELVVRPMLAAFVAAHPDAVLEIGIDYGFRDLVADRFDAGIRLGEKLAEDVIAMQVGPELCMAVVATPAYLARHGTPKHPRELLAHRCIGYRMMAADSLYAWEFASRRPRREFSVRVSGPLVFNEPGPMLDSALAGLGIAYVLKHAAAPYLADGRLVQLLADWTPPFPGFFVYHLEAPRLRPLLTAFLEAVRRHHA